MRRVILSTDITLNQIGPSLELTFKGFLPIFWRVRFIIFEGIFGRKHGIVGEK